MDNNCLHLLLADDDADDCMFFEDALKELPIKYTLKTVNDGEQLMHLLATYTSNLPDILFLDLNMPRKNGYECLQEIKQNEKLKQLPVVIYSTSFNNDMLDKLYNEGANHYLRKPVEFSKIKKAISEAISITNPNGQLSKTGDKFVIEV